MQAHVITLLVNWREHNLMLTLRFISGSKTTVKQAQWNVCFDHCIFTELWRTKRHAEACSLL